MAYVARITCTNPGTPKPYFAILPTGVTLGPYATVGDARESLSLRASRKVRVTASNLGAIESWVVEDA